MYSVNSLKWKRSIARFYHPRQKTGRKIILIYHAVGNGPWAISVENFKGQIQWLKKNCEIVSLSELLTSQHKKNITRVALTFDDGYACLHDTVLPILKTENAVAAVYINTGWMADNEKGISLGKPNPFLLSPISATTPSIGQSQVTTDLRTHLNNRYYNSLGLIKDNPNPHIPGVGLGFYRFTLIGVTSISGILLLTLSIITYKKYKRPLNFSELMFTIVLPTIFI